ncbi:uncharacterized protein LOC131069655 [Cryptomeria japonica]|uniref:uncharacterized protein LOC131069655 n=1 Tax=Cryptomeria japonica TaxID=3369 RepID=UPI0025AD76D8|nr:uncharacterized protein LOC131069655 [Cryptomeria japonica]
MAPVWVRLPGLLLEFWDEQIFCWIGNSFGSYVIADSITLNKSRRRNYIKSIKDETGQEITGESLIGQSASDFFIRLYSKDGGRDVALQDFLVSKLLTVIKEEDNCQLTAPISAEEVCMVVFAMGAYKTPNSDGFPPTFFQDYLDIVSYDVTKVVQDLFKTGKLLKKIINTYIVLVPKTTNPSCLKEF